MVEEMQFTLKRGPCQPDACPRDCGRKHRCAERRALLALRCVECRRRVKIGDCLHLLGVLPLRVVHCYDESPDASCFHLRRRRRRQKDAHL